MEVDRHTMLEPAEPESKYTKLDYIIAALHDRWFDVDQIEFNEGRHEWRLFFGEQRRGPYDHVLAISGVEKYVCYDNARVGIYDMCDLTVDAGNWVIRLSGCIDIEIELKVTPSFTISVGGRTTDNE